MWRTATSGATAVRDVVVPGWLAEVVRPVWHTAAGFLAGVVWALILILPGWLRSPWLALWPGYDPALTGLDQRPAALA